MCWPSRLSPTPSRWRQWNKTKGDVTKPGPFQPTHYEKERVPSVKIPALQTQGGEITCDPQTSMITGKIMGLRLVVL